MVANPNIAPIVDKSVSFPICDSGISSSTTTKIIAPAANESAYGNSGVTASTKYAPNTPAIGSTIPDNCP